MRRIFGAVLGISVGLAACSDSHTHTTENGGSSGSSGSGGSGGTGAGGTEANAGTGAGGAMGGAAGGTMGGGTGGTAATAGESGTGGASPDGGGTGGTTGMAGSGAMDASDADAPADEACRRAGDNCFFVAWLTSAGRIAYAATNTQGAWSRVRTIPTRSTPTCVTLAVLREDNGNRFLWALWSTDSGGIDYAWSGNGFGWSAPDTVVADRATAACPAAAGFQPGATGNRMVVAWTAPDGSVKYATNTGVGAFSAPGQIAPAASTTRAPAIENVIEGDGTVQLWAAWSVADGSLQWARGDGTSWQARGLAFPANTSSTTPALGAMRDHGNYYGWMAWRRADGALLYGFSNASGWEEPVGIAPPGSTAVAPALGAWQLQATDGLMWVAWTQGTSIQYDTSDGASPFNTQRAVPGASNVTGPPALQAF